MALATTVRNRGDGEEREEHESNGAYVDGANDGAGDAANYDHANNYAYVSAEHDDHCAERLRLRTFFLQFVIQTLEVLQNALRGVRNYTLRNYVQHRTFANMALRFRN